MTKWFIGPVAALTVASVVLLAGQDDQRAGKPAPEFAGKLTNEKDFSLKAQLEKGPVMVVFISTVCSVTDESIKYFERIAKAYKEEGLTVVGVYSTNAEDSEKWRVAHKVTFAALPDPEYKVIEAYKIMVSPSAVLIGKDGNVVKSWEGYSLALLEEQSSLAAKALGKPMAQVDFTGASKEWQAG